MPQDHKEILTWCLHDDKADRGTSIQPDKAPVTKERRYGRSPTQETLGIIRGGGVQSFRPTHPDPPACNFILTNVACSQSLSSFSIITSPRQSLSPVAVTIHHNRADCSPRRRPTLIDTQHVDGTSSWR